MSNTNELYNLLCVIECDDQIGSGFLIAPNLIITADHVITPCLVKNASISAKFEGYEDSLNCTLLSPTDNSAHPIALLKLSQNREFSSILLSDTVFEGGNTAFAYGFFPANLRQADCISISCVRNLDGSRLQEDDYNVVFKPSDEKRKNFEGFSGAPIISNGHIAGILIEQAAIDKTAIRLHGICGTRFRETLKTLGIKFEIYKPQVRETQSINNPVVELQAVTAVHTSQIDIMLGELFEPIRNDRNIGKLLKSRTDLRDFLQRLVNRQCADATKAQYFYIGAVWMLQDQQYDDAETYYQEATKYNPGLDVSVYKAYQLMGRGQTTEAKSCLKPIDSTLKLNCYLSCLISEKASLSSIQTVVESTSVSMDRQTSRLLALSALQNKSYEDAKHYIEYSRIGNSIDVELSIIDSLQYYWRAMDKVYPNADRFSFAFTTNSHFFPNRIQQEDLLSAYSVLENIYENNAVELSNDIRSKIAWSLVSVSYHLPGKDTKLWLEEFRKYCYLHPIDILFCANAGFPIPEKMCDDFLAIDIADDSGIYSYSKLRLYIVRREYDQAKHFFKDNKEKIAKYTGISAEECELQLLIDCNDYSSAEKALKNLSLPTDKKERYSIGIISHQANRVIKPLIKRTTSLALTTKETIDFCNAITICRKYKKWDEVIKVAKEWWKTTSELAALEACAEAYYEKSDYNKCLRVIKLAEDQGDTSRYIRQHKMNAFIGLAKYDEARAIAHSFDDLDTSAKLTVVQARTYLAEGKADKAIQTLRSYADKDLYDLELYQLLIELTQADYPDLAYNYAVLLHQHEPENEQIIKYAGMIALKTGHDNSELSKKMTLLLQKDVEKGLDVRTATYNEVLEFIQKQNEQHEKMNKAFLSIECPVHMIADPKNNVLGGILMSIKDGTSPYWGRFGISKENKIDFDLPLLLDYTACITLCNLNLFEKVCASFKTIWLENHIFEIWINDYQQLKNVQKSVVDRDSRLSNQLKDISFIKYPSMVDHDENTAYNITDLIMLRCAQENNAFFIDEQPSGLISGNPIPDGWYSLNIHPCDFYAALASMNLSHPDYDESKVNAELVAKIKPKCNLVLDTQVLYELLDADALGSVFSVFNIIIPEQFVDIIQAEAERHLHCSQTAKWLEESCNHVSNLYSGKKINLIPVKSSKDTESNPYLKLLINEFEIASETAVTFVVDDRFCGSYHQISGRKKNSPIISTYDLITAMYENHHIDTTTYYNLIDRLLSMGYSYFVPPSSYIYNRLLLAQTNRDGMLEEYHKIQNIRRSVGYAFHHTVGLSINRCGSSSLPEFSGYLLELNKEFRDCLITLWNSHEPLVWRTAASDWLLDFVSDTLCDSDKAKTNNAKNLGLHQANLLVNMLLIKDDVSVGRESPF